MSRYPLPSGYAYRSPRNAAGHDAGHIHVMRAALRVPGYSVAACDGRAYENARTVLHDIGPTCSRCRNMARVEERARRMGR